MDKHQLFKALIEGAPVYVICTNPECTEHAHRINPLHAIVSSIPSNALLSELPSLQVAAEVIYPNLVEHLEKEVGLSGEEGLDRVKAKAEAVKVEYMASLQDMPIKEADSADMGQAVQAYGYEHHQAQEAEYHALRVAESQANIDCLKAKARLTNANALSIELQNQKFAQDHNLNEPKTSNQTGE